MKTCTQCYLTKPDELFIKKNGQPGKLCLPCRERAIRYQLKHREKTAGRDPWQKTRNGHYDKLVEEFGEVCCICGSPPTSRRLNIDHCHGTQRIRGLLCTPCNMGLGMFKDSEDLLLKAIQYLKK